MQKIYNKQRHLELLKSMPKQIRSLDSCSTEGLEEYNANSIRIPDENCRELLMYNAMLVSHLQWENREYFYELIENLDNKELGDFIDFENTYITTNDAVRRLTRELIIFEPNPKSAGFNDLLDNIMTSFDEAANEDELKIVIQHTLLEMKESYL